MPIKIDCPHCGTRQNVADVLAGFQTPCEHCRSPIHVPSAGQSSTGQATAAYDTPSPAGTQRPFATLPNERDPAGQHRPHHVRPAASQGSTGKGAVAATIAVLLWVGMAAGIALQLQSKSSNRSRSTTNRATPPTVIYQHSPDQLPHVDPSNANQRQNNDALRRIEEINRINRENAQRRNNSINRYRQQPNRYSPTRPGYNPSPNRYSPSRPGVPTAPQPHTPYTP